MQTTGSLEQTSLATLLETMQAERATGTLAIQHGGQSCNLYFLFGHLFHAAGDFGQGEEAVIAALGWADGGFTFDPRAKLPAEETIKSATGDLLAEAERRHAEGHAEAQLQPQVAVSEPASSVFSNLAGSGPTMDEPPYQPVTPVFAGAEPAFPAVPQPSASASSPATSGAASWGGSPGSPNGGEVSQIQSVATPRPATATAPSTGPAGSASSPVYGNPDAAPIAELYPLPMGKAIYEGLKSAFVDFPKLLRTLDIDKLTGYVRLDGQDFSGVLLLHDGHVLEALFSEGRIHQGLDAFQLLRRRMEAGQGLLDVIELPGEIVVALAQLLTARPLFTGLLGRFINFDALLEYLAEDKVDGSLVVSGGTEMGVILFRKGAVLGSYTASNRELSQDVKAVNDLGVERVARIEVKSGATPPEGIDVEAALRSVS